MGEQKEGAADEIDLGQVMQRIGASINSAWMSFIRFLASIRRIPIENKSSFMGIIGASLVVALIYSALLQKDYYESSMILNAAALNTRLLANSIDNLDLLANEESTAGLAKALNIPDSVAANILGFESEAFITEEEVIALELLKGDLEETAAESGVVDEVISRIEMENRHSFEVTVRVLNPTVIPNLEEAVVAYLKNNEFVRRRLEIQRINLLDIKEKLIAEMGRLDSLQSVIYENYVSMSKPGARSGSNNVILSERAVIDPISVFNQNLALYREVLQINASLYMQSDFEIVDGLTEFTEPASPSLALLVVLALFVGLVIAYLDVAVRSFNNYLATVK